jgi:hypothetical protein
MKASDNQFPSVLLAEQGDKPATPASGYGRLYIKSDGLYIVDDGGNEFGPFATSEGPNYVQGARVYNNADISINHAEAIYLTFNSERYDTDTIHDTVSNSGRLTCKTAGKYIIVVLIDFEAHATGNRQVWVQLNGTTDIGRTTQLADSSAAQRLCLATIYDLDVNDYIEAGVYQSSTVALNISSVGNRSPEFMMQRIG